MTDTRATGQMEAKVLALQTNWLDTGSGTITTTTIGDTISSGTTTIGYSDTGNWIYPNWYYPWPHWHNCYDCGSDEKPIKLTFTEVEFLREKAKRNKQLKEILQKFTDYIQIEVDF